MGGHMVAPCDLDWFYRGFESGNEISFEWIS